MRVEVRQHLGNDLQLVLDPVGVNSRPFEVHQSAAGRLGFWHEDSLFPVEVDDRKYRGVPEGTLRLSLRAVNVKRDRRPGSRRFQEFARAITSLVGASSSAGIASSQPTTLLVTRAGWIFPDRANSSTCGITILGCPRPVTNVIPVMYISNSGIGVVSPGCIPQLVQTPPGAVERIAHSSPACVAHAATVIGYGPIFLGGGPSRTEAPSSAANLKRPSLSST